MGLNHYYIPYKPEAKVNYLYLFELMELADYNTATKVFDTITYTSIAKLAERLTLSASQLRRIIDDDKYKYFLSTDKKNKIITLNTCFIAGSNGPFVCLTDTEVAFLRKHSDPLLCKYLIYVKFNCGRNQKNGIKQDFTAKQFLSACGYSLKSNSELSQISTYNGLLETEGFISITNYYDEAGHLRNIYSYNAKYTYSKQIKTLEEGTIKGLSTDNCKDIPFIW